MLALDEVGGRVIGILIDRVPLTSALGLIDAALHTVSLSRGQIDVAHIDGCSQALSGFLPGIGVDLDTIQDIGDRHLVLGVAAAWGEKKGLDVFFELSRKLDDAYRIVLVGLKEVPPEYANSITAIPATHNQNELAQIYTAADVFVNPTREEALGMTNLEALACGTPVVTFRTGGSPETLDSTCGAVVDKNDTDAMEREIRRICENAPYSRQACRKRAELFDGSLKFSEYLALYRESAC